MAIKPRDIYEGTKKTHRAAKILVTAAVLLVALAIGLFFGLRQCCVYDGYGNATLILPFTEEWKAMKERDGEKQEPDEVPETTPDPKPEADPEGDLASDPGAAEGGDDAQEPDEGANGDLTGAPEDDPDVNRDGQGSDPADDPEQNP